MMIDPPKFFLAKIMGKNDSRVKVDNSLRNSGFWIRVDLPNALIVNGVSQVGG